MTPLSFTTVTPPQGSINGRFSPWVIRWQIPAGSPSGFVVQHMQVVFEGVSYCGDNGILDNDTIWNLLGYPDPARLDFWEAWQYRDGVWQRPTDTDGWGFSRPGTFYNNDTHGKIVFTGSAGFYEGDDLDTFGSGWGANGDNDGSPMSGDLLSTSNPPALPETALVQRSMTVEWNPCDCDSDDNDCRKTVVTVNDGDSQAA